MAGTYCGTLDIYYIGGHILYQQLGFSTITTFNNWLNGTLIPKAEDMIDNYVGHNFRNNTGTIDLDGNGLESLPITRLGQVDGAPPRLMPVFLISVGTVTIDEAVDTGTNVYSSCKIYDTFIVYEDQTFCKGRQNIHIKGSWGYTSVPHDIQYVTAQVCVNAMREAIRTRMVPDLITSVMEGGGRLAEAIMYGPRVLTPNEKEILERYRYREIEVG